MTWTTTINVKKNEMGSLSSASASSSSSASSGIAADAKEQTVASLAAGGTETAAAPAANRGEVMVPDPLRPGHVLQARDRIDAAAASGGANLGTNVSAGETSRSVKRTASSWGAAQADPVPAKKGITHICVETETRFDGGHDSLAIFIGEQLYCDFVDFQREMSNEDASGAAGSGSGKT